MSNNPYGFFKFLDKYLGTIICIILFLFDKLFIKKKPQIKPIQRILLIKLTALGDLVLVLPSIKVIKEVIKPSFIAVLTTKRTEELLENYKFLIDELLIFDLSILGLLKLIKKIRKYNFDACLDLDHYYKISGIIPYLSNIKNRIGFLLPHKKRLLYTKKVDYLVKSHEVEVFFEQVKGLFELAGIQIPNQTLSLVKMPINSKDREYIDNLLKTQGIKEFVIIHPATGKSAISRRWEIRNYEKLINLLRAKKPNLAILLTGSLQERNIIDKIKKDEKTINLAGKLTLAQFAELITKAKVFICADTGPMHLAAAMNTPVVALFGPNTPQKWRPYKTLHTIVYKDFPCSPCIKQYLGIVPQCKKPKCMEAISVKEVFDSIIPYIS